jgi:hypothetical protein
VIRASPVSIAFSSRISTGIQPARRGQLVHLPLVGEARLHHTEPAHGPARQVVAANGIAVDSRVDTLVRTLRVRDRVDQHRRRCRRVRAAIEHDPGLDPLQLSLRGRVVSHPDLGRVAVHMTDEALLAAVREAHRPARAQREQARVDLQTDVFSSAERAADSPERETHLVRGEIETRRDLGAVFVQPLRGDEQLDACTAGIGQRQSRFQPEEGLVLHPQLVRALDDHLADQRLVAGDDALMTEDVAVGWIGGWLPSIARSGSVRAGSSSYSTTIAASARRQVSGWSAATAAIGSPT